MAATILRLVGDLINDHQALGVCFCFISSVQTTFANGLPDDNVQSIGTLDLLFGTTSQAGNNYRFCIGVMPLWKDLKQCKTPLLFIAGEKDPVFVDISKKMYKEVCSSSEENSPNHRDKLCEMIVLEDCGLAVHLENPLPLITAVRKFITEIKK